MHLLLAGVAYGDQLQTKLQARDSLELGDQRFLVWCIRVVPSPPAYRSPRFLVVSVTAFGMSGLMPDMYTLPGPNTSRLAPTEGT
jgi:hypothetical protein